MSWQKTYIYNLHGAILICLKMMILTQLQHQHFLHSKADIFIFQEEKKKRNEI